MTSPVIPAYPADLRELHPPDHFLIMLFENILDVTLSLSVFLNLSIISMQEDLVYKTGETGSEKGSHGRSKNFLPSTVFRACRTELDPRESTVLSYFWAWAVKPVGDPGKPTLGSQAARAGCRLPFIEKAVENRSATTKPRRSTLMVVWVPLLPRVRRAGDHRPIKVKERNGNEVMCAGNAQPL